jgi:hypothetical protein
MVVQKWDMSRFGELFLFADDCLYLKPIFAQSDYDDVQHDVNIIGDWCVDNLFQLNVGKCKVMQFSYSNRPPVPPLVFLNNIELEFASSCRYLGVVLSQNPTDWKIHCGHVLRRAMAVFFTFRNFYGKLAPKRVLLFVFKCVIRAIIEYCGEIVLPNAYFTLQFERLQKLVVRRYFGDYLSSYDQLLLKCNLQYLSSRRAASAVVLLQKYVLGNHYLLNGFVCYGFELGFRRSIRRGTARDFVLVRNFPYDNTPIQFRGFSSSFKKSLFYRAVANFNYFNGIIDLDSYLFSSLRRVLSLFWYDHDGLVVV